MYYFVCDRYNTLGSLKYLCSLPLMPSHILTSAGHVLLIQGIVQVFGPQVIIVTYSAVWEGGQGAGVRGRKHGRVK